MQKSKKTLSLRTQLTILMTLLVILQTLALFSALSISKVFFMLDAESYRLFDSTMNARVQTINSSIGLLVANMAQETAALSESLNALADRSGVKSAQLYQDNDIYIEAARLGTDRLLQLLEKNSVTGAFILLDSSNANQDSAEMHSAVYIRNSSPGVTPIGNGNYSLEVGPIAISREYKIPSSVNWDLDIRIPEDPASAAYRLYQYPQWAAREYPASEMERYGYWSPLIYILHDRQAVLHYTMPLLDADNMPFGVVGIEISLAHFTQNYLPNTDLPYENSFFAITNTQDDTLLLDWVIPSGPLAAVYLQTGEAIPLTRIPDAALYAANLPSFGSMYCSAQPLTVYSKNSPFYDESWSLAGFVPQSTLHETSGSVQRIIIISIAITTTAAFFLILIMVYLSTRKISGLSKYIETVSPNQDIQFQHTGMREIDDLTKAVTVLNRSVRNASKTVSKVLELTLLPIGGFDVSRETGFVSLTEYVYRLLHLDSQTPISIDAWEQYYQQLLSAPVYGYENIYQYTDALTEKTCWLRIVTTTSEEGQVGVILDVTKDIEEHRRLAYELDYDGLTHLYNRVAFKREAHRRIMEHPDKIGAMIFSDLDNLKYVNDNFGHDIGDQLIVRAAAMFSEFEKHDALISRISGDEFAIYIHGADSVEALRERILQQYRDNEWYSMQLPDGSIQRIRSSSGIAWYPGDADNVTDLLKLSDFAMYEAKHNRKGSVFEFNRQSYQQNAYLLQNLEALNKLLDEELIRFAFQPIVDLRTGQIFAYELLMRSLSESFKSPLEIIRMAESQSKSGQLEQLVLARAFKTIREHAPALPGMKFFINSLPSHMGSPESCAALVENYADLFRYVVIEITEAENNAPAILSEKLHFFRSNGIQYALDDYGSGYSNELRILSISPDIVKIDIAMIQGIHENQDKQLLVKNILDYCHPKNISVIAEGVEEPADLAMLVKLGIDYAQGFYLGRPSFAFEEIPEEIKSEIRALYDPKNE